MIDSYFEQMGNWDNTDGKSPAATGNEIMEKILFGNHGKGSAAWNLGGQDITLIGSGGWTPGTTNPGTNPMYPPWAQSPTGEELDPGFTPPLFPWLKPPGMDPWQSPGDSQNIPDMMGTYGYNDPAYGTEGSSQNSTGN